MASGADETAAPLFDVGTMYDFGEPPPGLMDPTVWEIDPSGVHYRRPTQNEITKNRWHEDVVLVALESTVVTALKTGSSTTTLHIPLADPRGWPQEDLAILSVGVSLRGSNNYSTFTEKGQNQNGTITTTRSRPTYRYYLQQGVAWNNIPDHVVQVFSSSSGGVVLDGATVDRSFWLDGPYSNRNGVITIDIQPATGRSVFLMYTNLAPPTSFATIGEGLELESGVTVQSGEPDLSLAAEVGPLAVGGHTCDDGFDNDLVDGADGCDYACIAHPDFAGVEFAAPRLWEYRKTFVMFGDAMWCTQHEGNWDIALVATGASASQMLNWVEAPPEFGGMRVPPVLMVGQMCWPFKSITAAESCHWSSSCGSMTDYPFQDVDNKWGVAGEVPTAKSFLSRVWGAKNIPNSANVWGAVEAWTAANTGANLNQLHPVHMAAVVTDLHDVNDLTGAFGGRSFSNAAMWRAGGGVVFGEEFLGNDPEDAGFKASARTLGIRVAHEFAHTLGIDHDDATIMTEIGTLHSFMSETGGTAPILSDDVPSLVNPDDLTNYAAWATYSPGKAVPRPAGFAYRGCTNNASCPAGLSCVQVAAGGKICQ